MSDEAVPVYHHTTGWKILQPDRQLSNQEITDLFKAMTFQVSPEVFETLSPSLKTQFKETKAITHPLYSQEH
jgi:hypothetical protein